ncbi:hypothetical protein Tco_1468585 [Tanacetum coccineum]
MPKDQGDDMGNTEDQPNVEAASKHDWFKKPERPPTPDPDWNTRKQIDFRPPGMKRIFKKRTKRKPKMTKPSTEWKRQSQIEAKVSQSQKVNLDKVKEESKVKNTTPRIEVVKSSNSNHKDSFCKYSYMVEGLFLPSLKSYSPQGLAVQ